MKTASPLRYPGGKSTLADLLSELRRINGLGNLDIAEPFAGGAGASLSLLYLEATRRILINDKDLGIHDFWWTITNRSTSFLYLIESTPVTISEWFKQKTIYESKGKVSRLQRGFATFFLNRCNRSGVIVNGGPIGGIAQSGKWKLDARFNKPNLKDRCKRVADYRNRISVSCEDGLSFIEEVVSGGHFVFIDPPYFEKGPLLYLNSLDADYHRSLAALLKRHEDKAWVLTYDDCIEIRDLYARWATVRPFSLNYSAASRKRGKELFIAPKWLRLPVEQGSRAISW